jgi:hypothetical protein
MIIDGETLSTATRQLGPRRIERPWRSPAAIDMLDTQLGLLGSAFRKNAPAALTATPSATGETFITETLSGLNWLRPFFWPWQYPVAMASCSLGFCTFFPVVGSGAWWSKLPTAMSSAT